MHTIIKHHPILLISLFSLIVMAKETLSLSLRWDYDNLQAITGFKLERSGGLPPETGQADTRQWSTVQNITESKTTKTAVITERKEGFYCWRVKAYTEHLESEPSNEVCLYIPQVPYNVILILQGTLP